VAALLGEEPYANTAAVFQYFSGLDYGSAAVAALVDFYAGFGFPGWVLGSFMLGLIFAALDLKLRSEPSTVSRAILGIFIFVFCIYLAQASVVNAAVGYGGIIYLLLWLFIRDGKRPRELSLSIARRERAA
jgi:hypothetical protein